MSFAASQAKLLMAIEDCGSISAAAKQLGISYKTAWDRLDTLNNMSEKPLVVRSVGGTKGGGTALTDFGRKIVKGFLALEHELGSYMMRLESQVDCLDDVANFVRIGSMQTTARNQFRGEISDIIFGVVNVVVHIRISKNQTLSVIITEDSCQRLGLKKQMNVVALIKASAVMISPDIDIKTSASNKLVGILRKISKGAVNSDVVIDLKDDKTISAIITNASLNDLALRLGDPVCAFFKASNVILAVD